MRLMVEEKRMCASGALNCLEIPVRRAWRWSSLLVIILAVPAGATEFTVALLARDANSAKHAVIFLRNDTELIRRVPLGELQSKPSGFWRADASSFWAVAKPKGKRGWLLIGMDPHDNKELARIEMGRRAPAGGDDASRRAIFSRDAQRLFVLVNRERKWHVDVYETDSYTRVASTSVGRGEPAIALVGARRLLVTVRKETAPSKLMIVSPDAGKALYVGTFRKENFAVTSRSGYVYYMSDEKITLNPEEGFSRRKKGYVSVLHGIDSATGRLTEERPIGINTTPFYDSAGNKALYVAAQSFSNEADSTIWGLAQGSISKRAGTDGYCDTLGVLVDEMHDIATLLCEERIVHFRNGNKQAIKSPFTPREAQYDNARQRVFILQELDSNVALLNLEPLDVLGRGEIGRFGIRAAQAAGVSAAILAFGLPAYPLIPYGNYFRTSMVTSDDERYLFVLNNGTRDVTIFRIDDFDRVRAVPVGLFPYALSPLPDTSYAIALARNRVTIIDPEAEKPIYVESSGRLVGLDIEFGRMYFTDRAGLRVVDLGIFQDVAVHTELGEVYAVLAPR